MASIEWRSDHSFRVAVSLGYNSKGKKIIKRKSFRLSENLTRRQAEKEAQTLATLFEQQVKRGTCLDGEKLTFGEFIDVWFIKYAEKELAPKTIDRYKGLVKRIKPALGNIKLSKLQPIHLIDFYNGLREIGIREDSTYKAKSELDDFIKENNLDLKIISDEADITVRTLKRIVKGYNTNKAADVCETLGIKLESYFVLVGEAKPLSSLSILHHHRLISSMLTDAVQWQLIFSNPAERVNPPRADKKEASHYDEDMLFKMFDLLLNEPLKYQVMVFLTSYIGLRKGELMGLEWPDFNFNNNELEISRSSQYVPGKGVITKKPKNKTSIRTMALPGIAVWLVKEYKIAYNEQKLLMGDMWQNSNRLFVQFDGSPMHPDTISKWFSKFIKQNNLPKLTLHGLRHTNASILIGLGIDIKTIAGRLGHARASTTSDIYGHLLKKPDVEAANKLDAVFNKNSKNNIPKRA